LQSSGMTTVCVDIPSYLKLTPWSTVTEQHSTDFKASKLPDYFEVYSEFYVTAWNRWCPVRLFKCRWDISQSKAIRYWGSSIGVSWDKCLLYSSNPALMAAMGSVCATGKSFQRGKNIVAE